jgi:secreted trypsin-like serine protease
VLLLEEVNMLMKFCLFFLAFSTVECQKEFNRSLSRFKRNSSQCGIPSQTTSLVIGGSNFQRGSWPWMVALMQKTEATPKLFCGGVLISSTKILTGDN